jgi:hypothetical protein
VTDYEVRPRATILALTVAAPAQLDIHLQFIRASAV